MRELQLLASAGFIAYPFVVYLLLERMPALLLIGVLGILIAARLATMRQLNRRQRRFALTGVGTFCAVAWAGSELHLVKLYPVLVSVAGAAYGTWTLARPPSAVERIARAASPQEPFDQRKIVYTRRVTWMWVCFLIANGAVAAYSAVAASTGFWALYNGFISYLLIGALFGGEHLFRCWYRRRHYPTTPQGRRSG